MEKETEQLQRLHDRISYLEAEISNLYDWMHRRFDAAINEEIPKVVAAARGRDDTRFGCIYER
jgi:hypothetical protein